jgi:hypothetical protein
MLIRSETRSWDPEWIDLFETNYNALFQTALLLTANAPRAEAALVKSIEELEVSNPFTQPDFRAWERAVVMRSIETPQVSCLDLDCKARFMLQLGLRPIIQLDRSPRICFVLRMLLGYTTAACAQMLGLDEKRRKDPLSDGGRSASTDGRCHRQFRWG